MASKFNVRVAMDLKLWNGWRILHIIAIWSRYTFPLLLARNRPANIIDALMMQWVGKFRLSYDVASGSEITPCNKICKPLVVYRFSGKL